VRVGDGPHGARVLEVGGLDRADARAGLTEDVAELAQELSGTPPERVGVDGHRTALSNAPDIRAGASPERPDGESSTAAPARRKQ
jgi:cytochrome c biogenesis protein